MEAYKYPVSQGYKDIWIRVCLETIVTVLKIYKTNKEYIFGTFLLETTSTQINNWPEFPKHHIYLYFSL
jgi:hypothetical protein